MPTLDWLNKAQALKAAAQVPYRLLEPQSVHGDPAANNWLIPSAAIRMPFANRALITIQ
jgi:hypothetical protein